MGKVIGKFVIFLLPIFIVIGLFRLSVHAFDTSAVTFLPTWPEIIGWWASAPDPMKLIRNAMDAFYGAWSPENFEITDFVSFFTAIGAFFNGVGQFFVLGWTLISLPFAYIGWFITFLAGYDVVPLMDTSSAVFFALENAPLMPFVG